MRTLVAAIRRQILEQLAARELDHIAVVSATVQENTLVVVFDGDPAFREGRFGVRIPLPMRVRDGRWREIADSDDVGTWAAIAIEVEIFEPYLTYEGPFPDSRSEICWLPR